MVTERRENTVIVALSGMIKSELELVGNIARKLTYCAENILEDYRDKVPIHTL